MSKHSLRIICVSVDIGAAAHVGGPVEITHKTFDMECPPELAAWLTTKVGTYESRHMTGVELRNAPERPGPAPGGGAE